MTEKVVKEGFELAEKELKEKQIQEVKHIVLKTLEKVRDQEKIRDEAIDKIKILKMDIDDLKEGKLDRIVERQEKDEKAKQISVVTIIKEVHHHYHYENPWYVPYRIIWHEPHPWAIPCINTIGNGDVVVYNDTNDNKLMATCNTQTLGMITCSAAKDATIGAYDLPDGSITHIR